MNYVQRFTFIMGVHLTLLVSINSNHYHFEIADEDTERKLTLAATAHIKSINYTYIAISSSIPENRILGDKHLADCVILLRRWPFCVSVDTGCDCFDDFYPCLFGDGCLLNGLSCLARKLVWQLVSSQPRG